MLSFFLSFFDEEPIDSAVIDKVVNNIYIPHLIRIDYLETENTKSIEKSHQSLQLRQRTSPQPGSHSVLQSRSDKRVVIDSSSFLVPIGR